MPKTSTSQRWRPEIMLTGSDYPSFGGSAALYLDYICARYSGSICTSTSGPSRSSTSVLIKNVAMNRARSVLLLLSETLWRQPGGSNLKAMSIVLEQEASRALRLTSSLPDDKPWVPHHSSRSKLLHPVRMRTHSHRHAYAVLFLSLFPIVSCGRMKYLTS